MEIAGQYTRAGSYLVGENITLIIGTRQATPIKPKHYMLAKDRGKGKAKDLWISSLYPVPGIEGAYSLDHQGVIYTLLFDPGEIQAEIRRASVG